jgi:hypothetical protein
VQIQTTVTSDAGRVVFQRTDERKTAEFKGKSGSFDHATRFPLQEFAPGRYVLKVEARALISGGAPVAREVEFRVR